MPDRITEIKTVQIGEVCANPFYVRWQNALGGIDYWLFQHSQTYGRVVDKGDQFRPYLGDLDTARTARKAISSESQISIQLRADGLTQDQAAGLGGLLESTLVEYWAGGSVWVELEIDSGSWNLYDTKNLTSSLTFTVKLPDRYLPGR